MWGQIKSLPEAAIAAEKANKGLDAALEITGRNVPGLSKHFKDYADVLMSQTIYDDEAIKGAQALLVQLTNLDKDGIDKATKGAIGLASVFGMDLESAAQLVAKSMNGNVALLGRYGIKVSETTDKEKQRTEILDKLSQFYGRATAETATYGGQLAQLKNAYDEIKESAGKAMLDGMKPFMDELKDPRTKAAIEEFAINTGRSIGQLGPIMAGALKHWNNFTDALDRWGYAGKYAIKEADEFAPPINKLNEYVGKSAEAFDFSKQSIVGFNSVLAISTSGTNTFVEKTKDGVKKVVEAYKEYDGTLAKVPDYINKVASAQDKYSGALGRTKTGVISGGKDLSTYIDIMERLGDQSAAAAQKQNLLRQDMAAVTLSFAKGEISIEQYQKAMAKLGKESDKVAKDVKKDWQSSLQTTIQKWQECYNAAKDVLGGIGGLSDALYQKQQRSIDGWYKKQSTALDKGYQAQVAYFDAIAAAEDYENKRKEILLSNMTDKEKKAALDALALEKTKTDTRTAFDTAYATAKQKLDEEYEAKSEAARIKAAKAQKTVAIAIAVMNIAEGVTKAFAQGGLLGFITGALVAAAGAIQIATIKATPLAKGAIFKQPTLLPGMNGRDYQVAESGSGGTEIVATPENIRKAIGMGGKGGGVLRNYITVNIDGRVLKQIILDTVINASQIGSMSLHPKAVS